MDQQHLMFMWFNTNEQLILECGCGWLMTQPPDKDGITVGDWPLKSIVSYANSHLTAASS